LDTEILFKEGTLTCIIDSTTLNTLTGLTNATSFFNIDDISEPTQDDYLFIRDGNKITLYGNNVEDDSEPEFDYFRYNTPSEVIAGPGVYAAAQSSYPCLTFPAGFDLDSEFRVYHSMFNNNEGGFFGAFVPEVADVTTTVPLVYPGFLASGGIIWTGSDNPGSIITPQNYSIFTRDTRRKIVVGDSSLLNKTLVLPIDAVF